MVKIYLIRHGVTDWNIEKRHQGHKPVPLNETGRKQAAELAAKLKDKDIKAIYSSPLPRAFQTAEEINKYHNLEIIKIPGFAEKSYGELEGLTTEQWFEKIPDMKEQQERDGIDWRPPKGETLREFYSRVSQSFKDILEKHKDEDIAIITHTGPIRGILSYLSNSLEKFFEIRVPDNCEVIEIDWDGTKAVLNYE